MAVRKDYGSMKCWGRRGHAHQQMPLVADEVAHLQIWATAGRGLRSWLEKRRIHAVWLQLDLKVAGMNFLFRKMTFNSPSGASIFTVSRLRSGAGKVWLKLIPQGKKDCSKYVVKGEKNTFNNPPLQKKKKRFRTSSKPVSVKSFWFPCVSHVGEIFCVCAHKTQTNYCNHTEHFTKHPLVVWEVNDKV